MKFPREFLVHKYKHTRKILKNYFLIYCMFDQFMKLQEDRFILTTEIETEGSRYKITHKVVNYSNKKMDSDTLTYIFEGDIIQNSLDKYSPFCSESEKSLGFDGNRIRNLAKSQKQFLLNNMHFY